MTNPVTPGPPCETCRRMSGAVVIQIAGAHLRHFCSTDCARIAMAHDATPKETECIAAGGRAAGRYLDGVGKTDLAQLTAEEWATFCERLFVGTCEEMRRQAADGIPF